MEVLGVEFVWKICLSLWLIAGLIEYIWYLGLYRFYPTEYVPEGFRFELGNSPIFSRVVLFLSSMIGGPIYLARNIAMDQRPFVTSLN